MQRGSLLVGRQDSPASAAHGAARNMEVLNPIDQPSFTPEQSEITAHCVPLRVEQPHFTVIRSKERL